MFGFFLFQETSPQLGSPGSVHRPNPAPEDYTEAAASVRAQIHHQGMTLPTSKTTYSFSTFFRVILIYLSH